MLTTIWDLNLLAAKDKSAKLMRYQQARGMSLHNLVKIWGADFVRLVLEASQG